ncbi:MAG: VCBS repeat-containing protein, partial [Planctomycetota bacterium]
DGDPDIVVAAGQVQWYENQGQYSGQFAPGEDLWDSASRTNALLAADINDDGLVDIVGNAPAGNEVQVLYGVPGGPDGSTPTSMADFFLEPDAIAAGDFDEDGDIDVVVSLPVFGDLWWIENLSGDTFALPVFLPLTAAIDAVHSLEAVDLDEHGHLDFVAGGRNKATWSKGAGDGTFAPGIELTAALDAESMFSLTVADVDGDGRLDVIASSEPFTGSMPEWFSWARNLGQGTFEPGGRFTTGEGFISNVHAADIDGDLDVDILVSSHGEDTITAYRNVDGVGAGFCGPAVLHSGARRASITGSGSTLIADDDLTLQAFDLPLNRAGYFLVSRTQGFVTNPAGSQGNLCLGGAIGRYVSQVGNSGTTGTLPLIVRASSINQPAGSVSAVSGETWSFQCWFRDQVAGASTSNFTSGFAVRFR